ncbi:MAG: T9SS type A sorting domain-containing protein [Ignavibacteria bacterium]|jgi:hypothetical protein|nr:T9SS type A sorting domain-containing protein [Ignavibacteria bacterium]MDH7526610.1 T9SS type A sorting domain-containing protein [Ignavibacteria bacterium]
MKRIIYLIGLFSFLSDLVLSQNILWTKFYGGPWPYFDVGNCVISTSDGGYAIVGETDWRGAGWKDVWLIRTDGSGDTLWTRTYGFSFSDRGRSILELPDRGFIIVGGCYYETSYPPPRKPSVYIIRTDQNGDTLWTKVISSDFDSHIDEGYSVYQTPDNGFLITGLCTPHVPGGKRVYVLKIDSIGNRQWEKGFGIPGRVDAQPHKMYPTSDGGFIITGSAESYPDIVDLFIMKFNSSGDTLWSKLYGGSLLDWGQDVCETNDGGFIVTGSVDFTFPGYGDLWVLRTDYKGDTIWTKRFGISVSSAEGISICRASDGGYCIAGRRQNYVYVLRFNQDGDTLWTREIHEFHGAGYSVSQAYDGDFLITGTGSARDQSSDIFLLKITEQSSGLKQELNPSRFELYQNYPNPFNSVTVIKYEIPETNVPIKVSLKVYNILGEEVASLVNKIQTTGHYEVTFNSLQLTSGIYFYKLHTDNFVLTKKMVLIK